MTSLLDLDPVIKSALNHLHSTQLSSASDIRLILDSLIKKQHGSNKMLINRLSKKQLAEEESAPGVLASLPEPLEILDSPPHTAAAVELDDHESEVLQIDESGEPEVEDIEMNEDFNDLNCVVCESMMYSAANRLIECAECHSLVHQQCHTPKIEDDVPDSWICSNCKDKASLSKTPISNIPESSFLTKSSSSSSAPSSASSSPYHKSAEVPPSKTGSSKSSSSSSSVKDDSKVATKLSSTNSRSEKSSSSSERKHKSGSSSSKSSSSKEHHRKSKKSK